MSAPPPPSPLFSSVSAAAATVYSGNNGEHHEQSWIQSLKPSVLIIILILSITVLVSVSLCFIIRHLNRRCTRHFTATTTTNSSSSLASSIRRVSPEIFSPRFSVIDSLPLFTYSSITRRNSSTAASSGGDCAVCLSKFEPHDQLRLLPLCCHVFHAECIDTWIKSNEVNQTCPLCRSPIQASEEEIMKALMSSTITNGSSDDGGRERGGSFRLEIGSISRRRLPRVDSIDSVRSYSVGSYDYIVEDESEITVNHVHRRSISNKDENNNITPIPPDPEASLAAEVASGRNVQWWLKDYVDRLSSRALSFRSSGRFYTGSSRRSEVAGAMDYDLEANRAGEEISELFRWFSGV